MFGSQLWVYCGYAMPWGTAQRGFGISTLELMPWSPACHPVADLVTSRHVTSRRHVIDNAPRVVACDSRWACVPYAMLTWLGRVLRMTERLLTCHRTEISRGWTARQHRQRSGRPRHSGGTPGALRESRRSGSLGARLGPAHSGMPLDNAGDNKPAVGVRANLTAIVAVSGTPWRWTDGVAHA